MDEGFIMLRRILVSILLLSCISFRISAAENILSQPIMFSSDMEQHVHLRLRIYEHPHCLEVCLT